MRIELTAAACMVARSAALVLCVLTGAALSAAVFADRLGRLIVR